MKIPATVLAALLLVSCGNADTPTRSGPFVGTIVYRAVASGPDEEGAGLFRGLAANEITVVYGVGRQRIEEVGGINAGVLLLLPGEGEGRRRGIRLDPEKGTFENANFVNDLDAADPDVKLMLRTTYETGLEATGETAEICGYPTEEFRVTESMFVAEDAVVHLWIARDLQVPRLRVQADFEWTRVNSPLPLSFPLEHGGVLKVGVLENDVLVTYEATAVRWGTPDPSLFEIPEGYRDAE